MAARRVRPLRGPPGRLHLRVRDAPGRPRFQWRALHRPKPAKRDSWSGTILPKPRARWKVTKSDSLLTRTGIKGVDGGDPKGTSKAICLISNPAG